MGELAAGGHGWGVTRNLTYMDGRADRGLPGRAHAAFAFLGGVPQSILYDNTRLAVARILGDSTR
jgi:hypothetical protein